MPADRLAVGDAGLLRVDADAEPAGQPLDDHLQVDLALARDDRLVDLLVDPVAERRVLLLERRQADRELVLVALGAQAQGDVDVGIGVLDLGQLHGEARAAERVAGAGVSRSLTMAPMSPAPRVADRHALAAVQDVELARGARSPAGSG